MMDRFSRDDEMYADAYASLMQKGLVPPLGDDELHVMRAMELLKPQVDEDRSAARVDGVIIGCLLSRAVVVACQVIW
jgi:hypothetical protein